MVTPAEKVLRHYRRLQESRPATVTLKRGATVQVVTAVVGRTAFVTNAPNKGRVEWGERDYLIIAADIDSFGEPREGDRLIEMLNGVDVTFEATAPNGEPAVRWADPYRVAYRIHCQERP